MQCSSMLLSAVEILDFPFLVVDKSRSLDASCTQNGLKLELLEIMRACYLIARIHQYKFTTFCSSSSGRARKRHWPVVTCLTLIKY